MFLHVGRAPMHNRPTIPRRRRGSSGPSGEDRQRCWGERSAAADFAAGYDRRRIALARSLGCGADASAPAPDRVGVVVGATTTRNGVGRRREYGSGDGRWAGHPSVAPATPPPTAGARLCDSSARGDGGVCAHVRAVGRLAVGHAHRDHRWQGRIFGSRRVLLGRGEKATESRC